MPSIETRELEYFVQTARDGSISNAARNLYVSHQTLSKALANLERNLGVELFSRDRHGVELTECGHQLLEKAQVALRDIKACEDVALSYRDGLTGKVSVGVLTPCFLDAGGPIDGSKMVRIGESHPRASINFVTEESDTGPEAMLSGVLDMCIHDTGVDHALFDGVLLNIDDLAVLVSKKNPLSRKDSLSFEDLSGQTFALPSHNHDFAAFIEAHCREAGYEMKVWSFYIGFISWAKMVADNDVIVVLPLDRAWRTTSTETVAVVPLVQDGIPVTAPLYLLWRKGRVLNGLEQEVRDMVIALFHDAYPDQDECGSAI